MNRYIKKGTVIALTAAILATTGQTAAFAADGDYDTKETYLSLGADLSDSEKATVYELLGI